MPIEWYLEVEADFKRNLLGVFEFLLQLWAAGGEFPPLSEGGVVLEELRGGSLLSVILSLLCCLSENLLFSALSLFLFLTGICLSVSSFTTKVEDLMRGHESGSEVVDIWFNLLGTEVVFLSFWWPALVLLHISLVCWLP